MPKPKILIVIGIPHPEVPVLCGLVDIIVGLRVEELSLVEIDRVALRFSTFGGCEMLLPTELFGKFFAAIPTVLVFPLHKHSAGFIANQATGVSSSRKVELRG